MNDKLRALVDEEEFGFRERALPLVRRGIHVIPLAPRDKKPLIDDWPNKATLDRKVIDTWHARWPDANVGCVAVGHCFLDDDTGELRERIEAETGKRFPHTYTVMTSVKKNGKRGFHYYFQATAASIGLGNAKLAGVFDFQAENKQVVGAYSVHPSGVVYTPVDPKAPEPDIPDWLTEWIEGNSDGVKLAKPDGTIETDPAFDLDATCSHYNLAVEGGRNGKFYLPCPYKGGWHTSDGKTDKGATCILFDGSRVGFSCLATSCEGYGKSFGQLIKFLNRTHEPYRGVIWPEDQTDWDDWANIDYDDIAPEAKAAQETREKEAVAEAKAAAAEEAAKPDELAFPEDCLYGKLGEMARDADVPLGLAYPTMLAVWSAKVEATKMCGARTNVYCGLVTLPGNGKNQTIERCVAMAGLERRFWMKAAPAGDTQLAQLLGDKAGKKKGDPRTAGPERLLLVNAEITDVLKKTAVDNSTLASKLCDLWDDSQYTKQIGRETVNIDCRLSWLGGIPADKELPDRFTELFGGETNYGLYPRFLFGHSSERFVYRDWEIPAKYMPNPASAGDGGMEADIDWAAASHLAAGDVSGMTPEARALYDAWNPPEPNLGRLKFNLKKVAILSACANGDRQVGRECMAKAIRFMEWQVRLRRVFRPSEALNVAAQFREVALAAFKAKGALNDHVNWKRIANDRKWGGKYGDWVVRTGVENLIEVGELLPLVEEDGDGGRKKANKSWVMLNPKMKHD